MRTEWPAAAGAGTGRRAGRLVAMLGLAAVLGACGSDGRARTSAAPGPASSRSTLDVRPPALDPDPSPPARPSARPSPPARRTSARPTPARPTSGKVQPSGKPSGASTPPAPVTIPGSSTSYAAWANGSTVQVRSSPGGAVVRTLSNPIPSGAPLTFLLARRSGDWLRVYLPQRPNGSTGWVRASDVSLHFNPYRVDVSRSAHLVRVYRSGGLVRSYPIGVGTGSTPTPGGTFYLKELIRTTNPGGAYGPYAYGLSGFSNVLTSFGGGDGVIGLHGTNDPSSVGRDVSHGCIRLRNADITALTHLLPLGTPVRILA